MALWATHSRLGSRGKHLFMSLDLPGPGDMGATVGGSGERGFWFFLFREAGTWISHLVKPKPELNQGAEQRVEENKVF